MAGDEGSIYDRILRDEADPTRDALNMSRQASYGLPPAKAREILKVARETALPAHHLNETLDPVYKDKLTDGLSNNRYDAILQNAPSTARWATDPFRLAAGQEDLERLARIEALLRGQGASKRVSDRDLAGQARTTAQGAAGAAWDLLQRHRATDYSQFGPYGHYVRTGTQAQVYPFEAAQGPKDVEDIMAAREFRRLKTAADRDADDRIDKLPLWERLGTSISMGFEQGRLENQRGRLGIQKMAGDQGLDPAIKALEASLSSPGGKSFAARYLYPSAKILGQMVDMGSAATKRAYQGAVAGGAASLLAGPAAPAAVAPMALKGGMAGFGAGMAEQAFILEAGNAYLDLAALKDAEGRLIPEDTKQATAAVVGLLNAGMEMVGLTLLAAPAKSLAREFVKDAVKDAVVKPTVKAALGRFAKEYALGVAGETGTEVVQELITAMGEEVAKMTTSGDFQTFANSAEVRAQIFERLVDVGSETLRGTVLLGGLGGGVRLTADVRRAREEQRIEERKELATQFFEELKTVEKEVAASELAKENLAEIERVAHDALLDAGSPFRWLPARAAAEYFEQKGLDPVAEVARLTGVEMTPAQFVQTLERDGDIQFPAEKYISISQGEHVAFFQDYLRRDPDEWNMAETKTAVAEARAQEKVQAEQAAAAEEDPKRKAEVEKIKEDLDRITAVVEEGLAAGKFKREAKRMSAVARKVFERLAARTGRGVMDLWQDFGIEIRKGEDAPAVDGPAIEQPDTEEDFDGRAPYKFPADFDESKYDISSVELAEEFMQEAGADKAEAQRLAAAHADLLDGPGNEDLDVPRMRREMKEIIDLLEVDPERLAELEDGGGAAGSGSRFEPVDMDKVEYLFEEDEFKRSMGQTDADGDTAKTFEQSPPDSPPSAALSEDDKKFLKWEPERTEAGKLKGAPEWLKGGRSMPALRRLVRGLAAEGLPGRFWYEDSAREVLRLTGGDIVLAEKFIQLLAIYSPNNNVWGNTLAAVRVFNQWRSGVPRERIHAGTGNMNEKARAALFDNVPWEGRKTNSFYTNLMAQLIADATPEQVAALKLQPDMLEKLSSAVTVDVWMLRAFGYANAVASDDVGGTGRYSFVENEVRRIAAELNADLKPGEAPWLPRQVQAMIWTAIKARYEVKAVKAKTIEQSVKRGYSAYGEDGKWATPTTAALTTKHLALWRFYAMKAEPKDIADQVQLAKGSFATAMRQMSFTVTWEAIPAPELGLPITTAAPELREAYTKEVLALLQRTGPNDVAAKFGLTLGVTEMGKGGWEGEVNPNVITTLVPSKPAGEYDASLIEAYARAIQKITRQKAVPFFRADRMADLERSYRTVNPETGKTVKRYATQAEADAAAAQGGYFVRGDSMSRAMLFEWKDPITPAQEAAFWESLQTALNGKAGYTKVNSTSIIVANYRDENGIPGVDDVGFLDGLYGLKEAHGERLGIAEVADFGVDASYGPVHDWEADPRGDQIQVPGPAEGSPDLREWVDRRADEVARLTDERWGTDEALAQRAAELGVGQRPPRALNQPQPDPQPKQRTPVTFEQPKEGKGPRGRIVIGKSSFAIDLFESADRSTFLHELGHFYLEVMGELAAKPGADQGIVADLNAIREWMGLQPGEAITDDHHEKFARAFELYLSKGKAPTKTLEKAFWNFKRWINDIYREVKDYFTGIEITPKLKDVLDRMLASEDEIFEARMEMGGSLLDGPAAEILTPDQRRRLQAAQDEATAEAEARLLAPLMQEIDREEEQKWKDDRARLKEEELAALRKEPVYRLLRALTMKKEDAGPDDWVGKMSESRVGHLKSALPRGILAEDGVRPEFLADWFLFPNVNEMLYALAGAEDINLVAERRADERMLTLNPRMTPEEIHAKAREALHGPKREALLRLEMELLAESAQGKAAVKNLAFYKPRLDVLADEARREIEGVAVGALRPATYLAAEKRAAREMLAAALKGDLRAAIDAKLRELMNHERFRAAVDARDGVKEFIADTRKMAKSDEKLAKARDVDLVNAARAILAKWGVGRFKGEPSDYLGQLERYEKPVFDAIMAEVTEAIRDARPYKEATFGEFQRMREAVEALWEISKSSRQLLIEGKKVDFEEGKAAIEGDLEALPKDYANYGRRGRPTLWERLKVGLLSARALARRAEPWAQAMGDNFTKYIWNPINEAISKYRTARVDVLRKYLDAVRARPEIFEKRLIKADELDGYVFESKAHLLAAVLHSGNDSNLMKLVVGFGWGKWDQETETFDRTSWDAFVDRMQEEGILTKADYEFCQAIWDLNEGIKPVAQRAHREMFGRFFKEVTANAVATRWGTFKGGYVPAATDPDIVQDVAVKKAREEDGSFNAEYALPTTTKGFTIARAKGYAQPLLLDLRMIPKHIDEVLRFSFIQPRVNEVRRLLTDKDVAREIQAHDPAVLRGMLIPWLDRSVKQRTESTGWWPGLDRFFRAIRRNSGMQLMAGNITNALQNLTGLSVALVKVKGKHLRNAAFHWMTGPRDFAKAILERSEYMKQAIDNDAAEMLREIDDIVTNPNAFQKLQAASTKHAQILQRMLQNPVSMITWQGAFEQAMEGMDGNNEADVNAAIREADSVVRLTQGAQGPENIARFEAGTPFLKLFTQFMGYFNNKANLLGTEYDVTVRELGLKKGAGRLFGVYFFGHAVPAIIGTAILKTLAGTWDDEDEDGYLDEVLSLFFGSQFREATGYFPVVGPAVNVGIEAFGGSSYNDRVMNAPALSAFEKAVKLPGALADSLVDGDLKKRAVVDTLTVLGLLSGTPLGALGRPVGYAMDLEAGKANPDSPAGVIRGLLTGKRGE